MEFNADHKPREGLGSGFLTPALPEISEKPGEPFSKYQIDQPNTWSGAEG